MIFRAYFNRKNEAPQVWSIDEGTQESEVNVIGFVILPGCRAWAQYNGEAPNHDSPVAWLEIKALTYRIHGGIAYFAGE